MRKILISQCLQVDFVKRLAPGEPLPNLLHVGAHESERLLGAGGESPLDALMGWAYAQPEAALALIHIRDAHDPKDPRQAGHLAHFGAHCLVGTDGERPAFAVPPGARRRDAVVNSPGLNDFFGTELAAILAPYAGSPADVGLVGVWTEAKITYLAYELATRYPEFRLATCSALTASSSRASHFQALAQLQKILGVHVYDSVGEFLKFLGAASVELPALTLAGAALKVTVEGTAKIDPPADALIRYLFRDCREVTLSVLDGGFSGNLVLGTKSVDGGGREQAPHVLKIGPQALIARERTAFEQVEAILGNTAPRVAAFADYGDRGAIKYRYASMGGGASTSFQKLYQRGAARAEVEAILDEVFGAQLGKMYAAVQLESINIYEYYGFRVGMAARVRQAAAPHGSAADADALAAFYEHVVPQRLAAGRRAVPFAFVHGDLNGANIVVDAHRNVWLIDFFHTHLGHVVKDLVKLENDLLFIFTKIETEAELTEAVALSEALVAHDPVPRGMPKFRSPKVARAAETALKLRSFHPPLLRGVQDPEPLLVAQLRYAVHTLSFDEPSVLQKRWALRAAVRLVETLGQGVAPGWLGGDARSQAGVFKHSS